MELLILEWDFNSNYKRLAISIIIILILGFVQLQFPMVVSADAPAQYIYTDFSNYCYYLAYHYNHYIY